MRYLLRVVVYNGAEKGQGLWAGNAAVVLALGWVLLHTREECITFFFSFFSFSEAQHALNGARTI